MKNFEIERKFLLRNDTWRQHAASASRIRQAYLRADDQGSIRVRLREGHAATLTIKSKAVDLRRLELEYEIPTLEAELMLAMRHGAIIEKVRHLVPLNGMTWEVDIFEGANTGLQVAEIELESRNQPVRIPAWVGDEVTNDPRFYNSMLATSPFSVWATKPEAVEA